MGFFHTLAHDEAFWLTVAAIDSALAIALVVEGRTAREELDRKDEEHSRAAASDMLAWQVRAEAFKRGEGPHPGQPPPTILPKPFLTPKELPLAWRASLAWMALSVIAVGLVLCLIIASPLPDVATWLAAVGELLAFTCLVLGLALLVHITTRALTGGVGYWTAVKRVAQRKPPP